MNGKMVFILSCIAAIAACGGDSAELGQTEQAIAVGNVAVGTHSPFKCGLAPSDEPVDGNDPGT